MSADAAQIIQPLFGRSSINELSSAELESLLNEFPFFNAGHYLLARKLQGEKHQDAETRLQLAALHVNNPAWLQWLMKYDGEKFDQLAIQHPVGDREIEVEISALPIPVAEPEIIQPVEREVQQTENPETALKEPEAELKPEENTVNSQTVTRDDAPVFEPYYTIDYFASQGIRFIQEENPNDKLGRHLKSFTEWLRTMKRLPQVPVVEHYSEEIAEASIKVIAEHSVEPPEVLTEAMAEVLEKQGKTEEAGDIYRKLSLLNPDKSAYFAAKIQHLKAD